MLAERRLQAIAANRAEVDLVTRAAYADLLDEAHRHVTAPPRVARQVAVLQACRHEAACAVIAGRPDTRAGRIPATTAVQG
jgi:hypothetical protein